MHHNELYRTATPLRSITAVTQNFVDKIGADACGANAVLAVEKAKELI